MKKKLYIFIIMKKHQTKQIMSNQNKLREHSKLNSKSSKKSINSLTASPKSTNSFSGSENNYNNEKINDRESDNIFDLTKLVSLENEEQVEIEKNIINEEEREKLLKNYTEVERGNWEQIQKNTHIRYLRNDGLFRRGGFIKNIWINSYGANQGNKCIQLASTMTYKAQKWTVSINDINKIWKKNDNELLQTTDNTNLLTKKINLLSENVEKNKDNVDYLLKVTEQLKVSLKQTQNDQQRIMNLVKQIHGKISK